jgi:hypothetical protein
MAYFHLKPSTRHLTSTAGLMLIGQCLLLAELERLDLRLPKRGKITLSGLVKCYVALLTLGKSDFEAIEAFRQDAFLREALGLPWVPGSVWLRQQLEAHAAVSRDDTDDWSVRLLRRSGAPVTADDGYVCLDFDAFVMDNSGTQKECVGRTYQGVDGDTPIAAYLGNEGWNSARGCNIAPWKPITVWRGCCRAWRR